MNAPRRTLRRLFSALLGLLVLAVPPLATSCKTAPVTGRKELAFMGSAEMMQLGEQAYKEELSKAKVSNDPAANELVRRVGTRIAQAAMIDSEEAKNFKWEFTVIDDPKTVNAWCLPGGKVAVYTGILPVTQNEAGLATVLGHEVAHATAGHGNERVSQGMIIQGGEQALAVALSGKDPQKTQLLLGALGLGAQVGLQLPFSRKQESEADHIGLIYMARAGYDPQEAVTFWQRMIEKSGGQEPPAFLSDHPPSKERVENLKKWMPEAMKEKDRAVSGSFSSPQTGPGGSQPAPGTGTGTGTDTGTDSNPGTSPESGTSGSRRGRRGDGDGSSSSQP